MTELRQASLGRRIVALCADWAIALAISAGFFEGHPLATLIVFGVMTWVMISTLGATIGHTVLRLAVRRLDGSRASPLSALIRTVALCLVIPAVVWGLDGRGLHDAWAGTVIIDARQVPAP